MKIKDFQKYVSIICCDDTPILLSYENHQWYEIQPISFLIIGCALQIFGLHTTNNKD
jgi:hypothetical protein